MGGFHKSMIKKLVNQIVHYDFLNMNIDILPTDITFSKVHWISVLN